VEIGEVRFDRRPLRRERAAVERFVNAKLRLPGDAPEVRIATGLGLELLADSSDVSSSEHLGCARTGLEAELRCEPVERRIEQVRELLLASQLLSLDVVGFHLL